MPGSRQADVAGAGSAIGASGSGNQHAKHFTEPRYQ
jgi:hypothetical protein